MAVPCVGLYVLCVLLMRAVRAVAIEVALMLDTQVIAIVEPTRIGDEGEDERASESESDGSYHDCLQVSLLYCTDYTT